MKVEDYFLKYVSYDTQSDESSDSVPSTSKQLLLGEELVKELKELGIDNAYLADSGIVYAKLASNIDYDVPKLGFLAHMDTSPDMSGTNPKPRIIKDYDGETIVLNSDLDISMDAKMFPDLKNKIHHDLIVTDGTTLLGADDKAGVAEIMKVIEVLIKENKAHGALRFAFTCDEEIGRGTDHFSIEAFDADYGFTVDGSEVGSVDFENFNAASAKLIFHGTSIHPGEAKGTMINALHLAMEFHQMLPVFKDPANTCGYEGFHHLCSLNGECEQATSAYIIREFDSEKFEQAKKQFVMIKDYLNDKYRSEVVSLVLNDSYYNMRNLLEKDMYPVNLAKEGLKEIGINPKSSAIRGGTDGARLTYDGLLCPNLGTGGYNYHGKYEYASIQEMNQSVEAMLKMIEISIRK